jgi:uncharacterized membrane protein
MGMRKFFNHFKKFIFRGIITLIPLVLTILIIRFLYFAIDQRVMSIVEDNLGISIPGLGFLILGLLLYLIGVITSSFIGNRIVRTLEFITNKIPLVGKIYNIGQQLTQTFSLPEKQVFKKAVLVEFLREGAWTIGFVTGKIYDENQDCELLKIYVPTPPNPTSGFLLFVREEQVRDPNWSMDTALKITVSCGILTPENIQKNQAPPTNSKNIE